MAPRRDSQRKRLTIMSGHVLRASAMLAAAGFGLGGWPLTVSAQPVVQQVPGGASHPSGQSLNAALARLARDPRDLAALIDAGNAALMMGDVDAAVGFFARADQLSPNNMRVKAGLAGALVRSENPYDAIPLFAEADKAGALDAMLLSDRGLAYDLVGDNVSAQRYYRQSLAAGPNDETTRRLGLSQAISGDKAGMETTLAPLLQRQDKGGWRTRAFSLAILGRTEDAVAIANQTMPADLAAGIAPYLRYMGRLTPAQQAAAANFGRFPRAAEIGHDDPRVALYAPPRHVASADAGLVPSGDPLGRGKSRRDSRRRDDAASAAPPPVVVAAATPARSAPPEPMPGRQVGAAPSLVVAPPQPSRPVPAAPPASAPRPASSSASPPPVRIASSGFDLSRVTAAQAAAASQSTPVSAVSAPVATPAAALPPAVTPPSPAVAPVPVRAAPVVVAAPPRPAAPPLPPKPRRVADAFADLSAPTATIAPAPGAVDVRKIKPKAPEIKQPPKPSHPSRIWVQVGTGRDVRALGFTWRALVKDNPELFRGKEPSISDWGRTNRLLTGPFATEAAANTFLAKLKKAQLDAFEWTSPAGQVVDELP